MNEFNHTFYFQMFLLQALSFSVLSLYIMDVSTYMASFPN